MSPVNTDELEHALLMARQRVLKIQTKLHRWARDDPHRRFDDLFNLVADPAFLLVAWDRVSGNKGATTAGVDGRTAPSSRRWKGSGSSSASCGRRSRIVVSARCRCASG
jgi:RNA-directed DNA polymerase